MNIKILATVILIILLISGGFTLFSFYMIICGIPDQCLYNKVYIFGVISGLITLIVMAYSFVKVLIITNKEMNKLN